MSAEAIIARRIRQTIQAFRALGAISPETARAKEELDVPSVLLFQRLLSRGVIVELAAGRYYLDEPATEAYLRARRRRAWSVVVVALLVGLYLWLRR